MGARGCLIALLFACGPKATTTTPPAPAKPATMAERVVADFENATKTSREAYVELFDFTAVGEFEILLHRYDLNGRLPGLPLDLRAQFEMEDGTPYPPERERRNVGNFYPLLAQRTVGTGGCVATEPRTRYAKMLATAYEPLPAGTPEGFEKLRITINGYLTKGGVVRIACKGGEGGLALVWTERPNQRGYDLITIYDD